jgi:RNA polymerase sigma factor (sigma-70 family)
MPPPASGLPARLVLGPALRAQSDRRLVRLVREGYESAFEEIVRRYRRPLDRFAASIVGGRSEDVTQDAFRKALVALRREEGEIELRPWLYRIVRNTALNDLRDRPPAAAELADDLMAGAGGRSAAAEAEQRAEVAALTTRMRALPENQRAALVMRELEGMSHEEIAAALGISGGAARQAIARGRAAVRTGFGVFVPLPLLRALAGGGDPAAEAAIGAGGAGAAAGSGGAALLGGGGAGALKVGLATVVVAGSIGAGVAIDHGGNDHHRPAARQAVAPAPAPASAPRASGGHGDDRVTPSASPVIAEVHPRKDSGRGGRDDGEDHDVDRPEQGHGDGRDIETAVTVEPAVDDELSPPDRGSGGPGPSTTGGGGGPGSSNPSGGHGSGGPGSGSGHADQSASGDSDHSGGSGHGSQGSGSGDNDSGSHSSGSSDGDHGSDDPTEAVVETPPAAEPSSSGSSSGGPGPSSSGGDDSSGPSDGPSPTLESVTDDDSDSDGGSGPPGGPEISP